MGRIKNSIPDYIDINDSEDLESYAFRQELNDYIEAGEFQDNSLLREFLEDILSHKGPNHFIMISDKDGRTKNIAYTRQECIDALCCLSQYEFTLYFHPATFTKWIENKYAVAFRCLYIDIDDVGMIADETDYDDVARFLQDELGLTPDKFPKWCSLSGHGLHLVFPIDEYTAEEEDLRVRYLEPLIALLGGDIACKPISHMFRCPTSINLKHRPIKGKLFKMNDSTDRDIHRLDWIFETGADYEAYRAKSQALINEKRNQTIRRNKQAELDFLERLGDESLSDFLNRQDTSEQDREIATKILKRQLKKAAKHKTKDNNVAITIEVPDDSEDELYYDKPLPYKHLEFYNNYSKSNRTRNLLQDLHNFFIRSKGCLVSRNMFFFIIANFLKFIEQDEDYAVRYCYKYVDADYYNEMCSIISRVYHNKKIYKIRYSTIADLLGFSDVDIERSYCNFSDEIRRRRKKEYHKQYYTEQKEKAGKTLAQVKKESQLEFVRNNPDLPDTEIMKALGISRSTVQRLKKKI